MGLREMFGFMRAHKNKIKISSIEPVVKLNPDCPKGGRIRIDIRVNGDFPAKIFPFSSSDYSFDFWEFDKSVAYLRDKARKPGKEFFFFTCSCCGDPGCSGWFSGIKAFADKNKVIWEIREGGEIGAFDIIFNKKDYFDFHNAVGKELARLGNELQINPDYETNQELVGLLERYRPNQRIMNFQDFEILLAKAKFGSASPKKVVKSTNERKLRNYWFDILGNCYTEEGRLLDVNLKQVKEAARILIRNKLIKPSKDYMALSKGKRVICECGHSDWVFDKEREEFICRANGLSIPKYNDPDIRYVKDIIKNKNSKEKLKRIVESYAKGEEYFLPIDEGHT